MKQFVYVLIMLISLWVGIAVGQHIAKPAPISDRPKLAMELVGVTPHGHQIYKKQVGDDSVYVLVRAGDGYPMGIAK